MKCLCGHRNKAIFFNEPNQINHTKIYSEVFNQAHSVCIAYFWYVFKTCSFGCCYYQITSTELLQVICDRHKYFTCILHALHSLVIIVFQTLSHVYTDIN